MTTTTRKQKFVEAIINAYGLEPDAIDITGTGQGQASYQDVTASEKKSDKDFINAMLVMKKVSIDGQPGVIRAGPCELDFMCIGSAGAAYNLPALQDLRVTHVLCMADVCRKRFPDHFIYKKVYCRDTLDQDLFAVLDECFSFINDFRESREAAGGEGRILIHCYQGVSRAASICVAYMVKFLGCSVDSALQQVRLCRPQASPNFSFMRALRALEAGRCCQEEVAAGRCQEGVALDDDVTCAAVLDLT